MGAREIGATETEQQCFAVILASSLDLKRFCLSHRAPRLKGGATSRIMDAPWGEVFVPHPFFRAALGHKLIKGIPWASEL
jgi:hypothetical protein